MYIKRDMENIVLKLTKEYPAILITGPRQVGKTTMLQNLMKGTDRAYVSLDDLNARSLAKSDPDMFFQVYKTPILIDEVQYAPELFTYIKIMIDKNHTPGEFWLTGSQIFKLMGGVQESLAGRVAVLNLSSLSQNEIYNQNNPKPFSLDFSLLAEKQKDIEPKTVIDIFKRIYKGSMPSLVSGAYLDNNIFYSSYVSTYIERDVKEISGSIDSLAFFKFIVSVSARTSQLVNYADIARDAEIDQTTAKKWLRILETLGIIFYLHPFSNNTLKRTIKTPKLYFYDTGLVSYLTKWSSAETLESGAMNGAIFENYVVSEIIKSYYNSAVTPFIYYYRDKDAREIDIVIEKDGKLFPIEIKKTGNPPSQLTRVFKLLDNSSLIRSTGAILCMANKLSAFTANELIVPVSLI
ncbi:MAG: ATP-binding protein [Bacillota bacterium]|nr:ATP-binding protein [Bacillota bacterium]